MLFIRLPTERPELCHSPACIAIPLHVHMGASIKRGLNMVVSPNKGTLMENDMEATVMGSYRG